MLNLDFGWFGYHHRVNDASSYRSRERGTGERVRKEEKAKEKKKKEKKGRKRKVKGRVEKGWKVK